MSFASVIRFVERIGGVRVQKEQKQDVCRLRAVLLTETAAGATLPDTVRE